jgi:hypothetical protein
MRAVSLLTITLIFVSSLALSACNKVTTSDRADQPTIVTITDQASAPSISLEMTADHIGGFNLHVQTENFTLTPTKLGQAHVEGEGYLQVLINGSPVTRMYQTYHHLNLNNGDQVSIIAVSNDGRNYQLNDQLIKAEATATGATETTTPTTDHMDSDATAEHAAHGHDHDKPVIITRADQAPAVQLTVTPDPVTGWNARLVTQNFGFTPELVNQEITLPGQGHAHIYLDGEKIGRVYGEWFYLPQLTPGDHQIKVSLNGNSHNPYSYDGVEVTDSVNVTVD